MATTKKAGVKKATPAKKAVKKIAQAGKTILQKKGAIAKKIAPVKKSAPSKKVAIAKKVMPVKKATPLKKTAAPEKVMPVNKATPSKKAAAPEKAMPADKSLPAAAVTTAKPATGLLLEDFFVSELKDIYWAENHLLNVLLKMSKNASSEKLKNAFEDHRKVTEGHVKRLENIFELMSKKAQAKKCEAIVGITKEGEDIIDETEKDTETRDAGLILAAKKVEHYEIATYSGLAAIARSLGKQNIADILDETLAEENEAVHLLTDLAKSKVNIEASKEKEADSTNKEPGFFNKVMEVLGGHSH